MDGKGRYKEVTVKRRTLAGVIALVLVMCMLPLSGLAAKQKEKKKVLYTGIITRNYKNSYTKVYKEQDKDSDVLGIFKAGSGGTRLEITAVYPYYVEIVYGGGYGYVVRGRVDEVVPVDMVNTPPYGVEKYHYYARIHQDTPVLSDKKQNAETLSLLTDGACVAVIGFEDGWAKVLYKRQYGYIDSRMLSDVLPVAKTVDEQEENMPIAVFSSFFSDNPNRINNLNVGCMRLCQIPLAPGERLDFNNQVGRFNKANGYLPAPILTDGITTQGMGGGSCQVSSTLYNAVLQLPGITVLERHAHGDSGAAYLPHGVDASSGGANFRIQNDYPFPVRFEYVLHDFCMTILVYRNDA